MQFALFDISEYGILLILCSIRLQSMMETM